MPIPYITGLTALCTLHSPLGALETFLAQLGAPGVWPDKAWGRYAELVERRALA